MKYYPVTSIQQIIDLHWETKFYYKGFVGKRVKYIQIFNILEYSLNTVDTYFTNGKLYYQRHK